MQIDVFFGADALAAADTAGRSVAVIDVLRASTSIAAALVHGAHTIIPLDGADEVITRAKAYQRDEVVMAGERRMVPVPGFDLGNSPHEFTAEAVRGKIVLLSTTNGTRTLLALQGARQTVVAAYGNFTASVEVLHAALARGDSVSVVCSGSERHFSLEDAACAGRIVRFLREFAPQASLNDAARAAERIEQGYGDNIRALFDDCSHGRALAAAGFERDLDICASLDAFPVVALYEDHRIRRSGEGPG